MVRNMCNKQIHSSRKIRVLVVDNNDDELEMTRLLLKDNDSGLNIEITNSPQRAYEMTINSGYDCIVTDFRMPNINGLELVRLIRESSDVPIIMFTGYGNEQIAAAGIEAGLDGYMWKRSELRVYFELASLIRRLVGIK